MRGFRKSILASLAFVLFCFGAATVARADTVTLTNTDTGWYNNQGFHDSTNKNYLAGTVIVGTTATTFHNFFVFNVPVASGTITGAQIRLFSAVVTGAGTFSLFDVTTPVSELSASQTTRTETFADLDTGISYGSTTITLADGGSLITIDL